MLEAHPLSSDCLTSDFGSKAYNLSRLSQTGFSVPQGFAISPAVHERWCTTGCINELISTLEDSMRRLGRNCDHLIVRSSALGEDGGCASFAGQLLSLKCDNNQRDVLECILRCWKAIEEEHVKLYGKNVGVKLSGLGILVQEFIDATVSGVVFTQSPLNEGDLLIEYCDGGCHKLVSGQTKPNRIALSRKAPTATMHHLNGQREMSNSLITKLHKTCMDIENLFGMPMDIEWVFNPQKGLQIVQARPITTTMAERQSGEGHENQMLWTNSNMAENYPEPACPLLFSIARRSYECYFRELGKAFGVSSKIIEQSESELSALVGSHRGHLYYNLTNIIRIFSRVSFAEPLIDSWCKFLGIKRSDFATERCVKPTLSHQFIRFVSAGRMLFSSFIQLSFIPLRVRRFERRVESFFQMTMESKSPSQIKFCLQKFSDVRFKFWLDSSLSDALTMLSTGALRLLSDRWMQSHNAKSFLQLSLASVDRLESKRPLDELSTIERLIRKNSDAMQIFGSFAPNQILKALRESQKAKDVVSATENFIASWGFRFGGELLLNRKSWIEDPTELLNQMKKRLEENDEGIAGEVEQKRAKRQLDLDNHLKGVKPVHALVLKLLAGLSRTAIRFRERSRIKQAQLYCGLRFTALASGKLLKEHHMIEKIDDVFYLEFDELRAIMSGSYHLPGTLRELIDCRKKTLCADRLANKRERVQQTLEQWWSSANDYNSPNSDNENIELHDILCGTGASQGIAQAEASVVVTLDEIERVKRGSILVTRFTDPGWSSVFPIVRGLVLERGGILCHGAIIAREYGIPTITDVESATEKIKDGQLLKIDGNQGTVHLV